MKALERINQLKKQRNAVILAHNYQTPEIQDLADFCGDSLGLSVEASKTTADVIVFCGVKFMAETAAILSPQKTVLLPDLHAGCPMADMVTAEQLRDLKSKHPDALVVCYVNSTAEVKAESDYCCTSSNAVELVRQIPAGRDIIFVPDRHLGDFVQSATGRKLILWPGYCPIHQYITADDLAKTKAEHPDAIVLAHPECSELVKELADQLLSTGQMLKVVRQAKSKKYIIATEKNIIHAMKKENPNAQYIPASDRAVCVNMKKITLDKVLASLEDMIYPITVEEPIRSKAKTSLDRMVQIIPAK